jgi:hypothetical protein
MADVGFVLSIAFFIRIVVAPMRTDEKRARVAANMIFFASVALLFYTGVEMIGITDKRSNCPSMRRIQKKSKI